MIKKIVLQGVACFKEPAVLETNKKVNLIYGLNGTGKTTLTDYLYDPSQAVYGSCSISIDPNEEVLVYNQSFIRDYFYQVEELPGIFTLSKENKDAEQKVKAAERRLVDLEREQQAKRDAIAAKQEDEQSKRQDAENRVWEIKTNYSGGDRPLEYCLAGLMGRKEALFNHLHSVAKPAEKPIQTAESLTVEVNELRQAGGRALERLPEVQFIGSAIENNPIFRRTITGSDASGLAAKIKELQNSDWVRKGLDYLPGEIGQQPADCPFCQEPTVTSDLLNQLRAYFDGTYEEAIAELHRLSSEYESAIELINSKETYIANRFVAEIAGNFEAVYSVLTTKLKDNASKIKLKLATPSDSVSLASSAPAVEALNALIHEANVRITEYNKKIENSDTALAEITKIFWSIMRWEYDQTLSAYDADVRSVHSAISGLNDKLRVVETTVAAEKTEIELQQKRTVNIDEAIQRINGGLLELGIDGFHVERHSEVLYRIVRDEDCEDTFQTLSEGEKMVISFLYFREFCRGRKSAAETPHRKSVVIDDPVSSLSHIYVFNVGQMIRNDFFNSPDYEQVFVLTHSLYFFYELTDTKHDRRKQSQELFRICKNPTGSKISQMDYEEIQNDYQSYWHVVCDRDQPAALIANCMRNIIEYFFNFIEKRDLNNVFQKPALSNQRYQAFHRYINRESHSLGQNIFDFKEFDYAVFREAFRLVFEESGYSEHYAQMIKHGT